MEIELAVLTDLHRNMGLVLRQCGRQDDYAHKYGHA